ncbi:MAG: hypothetical protein RMI91_03290 [Gemmatales bacterium]|nr:hypothetical protein [Gemmatales bacterium]MDW7993655.1 hypothetical protein [Gemmatales bacterium]
MSNEPSPESPSPPSAETSGSSESKPRRRRARTRPRKAVLVAFKIEPELANILDQLPNKSDFIRRAIISQLNMACPLCAGTGVLPRGLHDHYAQHLREIAQRNCERCGRTEPLPVSTSEIPEADRPRLEQFFFGGPFYCHNCYAASPTCRECGWHIAPEQSRYHHHRG